MNTMPSPRRKSAAQRRYDTIKAGLEELAPVIQKAYENEDWIALGYADFREYCQSLGVGLLRLPQETKLEITGNLSDAGATQREIAAATGVSQPTAGRNEAKARPGRVAEPRSSDSYDSSDLDVSPDFTGWLESQRRVIVTYYGGLKSKGEREAFKEMLHSCIRVIEEDR